MKRFLFSAVLMMQGYLLSGQYIPYSNQAFQYASVFNPAFSGVDPYGDMRVGYRSQWSGMSEAPKFINLTYNFRLVQPADIWHDKLRTSIPTGGTPVPNRKRLIHALGVNLFSESVGRIDRVGGGVNYSFHYPVSTKRNIRVATGIAATFENTKVKLLEAYLGASPDPDPFYESIVNNGINYSILGVRTGVLLYSPRFYFGLSYLPLVHSVLGNREGVSTDPYYRGSVQAGASFPLGPVVDLKPSIMGILQTNDEFSVDYNLKVFLQKKVYLGVGYRSIKTMVGLIGFSVKEKFIATYSYEFAADRVKQFGDGSHEIVLNMKLNSFSNFNPAIW